jgi:hypothetical protein
MEAILNEKFSGKPRIRFEAMHFSTRIELAARAPIADAGAQSLVRRSALHWALRLANFG